MPRISAWLTDPEVELPGPLGRRYTFITDGKTSRIIERPMYDPSAPPRRGPAWPAAKSAERSPWLVATPVQLAPGQTLITDGKRAWPKDRNARRFIPPVSFDEAEPPATEEEECIPVTVTTLTATPFTNPFNVGDITTLSHDATGTAPITQEWWIKISGVFTMVGTDPTYELTITEDMVHNIDPETYIGKIFLYVVVFNDCGEDQTDPDASYDVQTTP